MDDPSCISFSENIDESPNRQVAGLGSDERHEQTGENVASSMGTHFKIYEFNYNEYKTQKSAMSSTDRQGGGARARSITVGKDLAGEGKEGLKKPRLFKPA